MRRLFPVFLSILLLFSCDETSTNPPTEPDLSHIQALLERISVDSLLRTVGDLSGETMPVVGGEQVHITSRMTGTDGNRLAAVYLRERLTAYGLSATFHRADQTKPNVIAVKQGTVYPERRIVICAHFDNTVWSTYLTDTIPGADDNASGTAAVIEAARVLSSYQVDATLIFALFNEEEQELVGSTEYAQESNSNDLSNTTVINMDMIAWDDDNDHVLEVHTRPYGGSVQLAETIVYLNAALGLGLNTIVRNPGTSRSDHAVFWTRGASAVLLIEEMEDDFNDYYHTPNDLIVNFNDTFYHKSARLGIGTAALLAGIRSGTGS